MRLPGNPYLEQGRTEAGLFSQSGSFSYPQGWVLQVDRMSRLVTACQDR